MDFLKKFISFLIVAIIFAVGGYFVGHGSTANQGASIYSIDTQPAITDQKKCERKKGWHWVGNGVGGFYCTPRVVTGTPSTPVPASTTVNATTVSGEVTR